jgi:predicted nucleotidyltransferase
MGSGDADEPVRAVLDRHGEILEAYLFGSHARGEAAAHSDVDVAVFADLTRLPAAPFGYESGLAADLMSALGTSRVDVVLLNQASPLLYHRVLRDGRRLISRDLRATTVREGRALSRYFDYLPHLAKLDRALRERIEEGAFGR